MCAKLVEEFDLELDRLRLIGQDLLDMLCLNEDLRKPEGCSGPCLAAAWKAWQQNTKNTGEFMRHLRDRATHVSGAFERLKNDKHEDRKPAEMRHKLHNNTMKFIGRGKGQATWQRFLYLLQASKINSQKATLTWSCCNTIPTINLLPQGPVYQRRADESAPSPPKEGCTQNDGGDDDDDGDASVQKAGPAAVPAKPKILCLCGKEASSPRKFKTHGGRCPQIPQQARAKTMETSPRKCIWGCDLSFSLLTSLWTHEQLPHYLSASGKIGTKRRVGSLKTTKLESAEYFSSVDDPDTEAFLENKAVEVASGMDPDSARLVLQNMEVFAQKLRPALQKQSVIDGSDANVRSVSIEPSPVPEQSLPIASESTPDVPTAPRRGTKRKRGASEDTPDEAFIVVASESPTIADVEKKTAGNSVPHRDAVSEGASELQKGVSSQELVSGSQLEAGGCLRENSDIEQLNPTSYADERATKLPEHEHSTVFFSSDCISSAGNATIQKANSVQNGVAGETCDDISSNAEIPLHEIIKPRDPSTDAQLDGPLKIEISDWQKWLDNAANVISGTYFGSPGGISRFLSVIVESYVDTPPGQFIELPKSDATTGSPQQVYSIETGIFRSLIKKSDYGSIVWERIAVTGLVHVTITLSERSLETKWISVGKLLKMLPDMPASMTEMIE